LGFSFAKSPIHIHKKSPYTYSRTCFAGWVFLNGAARKIQYRRKHAGYPLYIKRAYKNNTDNWKTILARKIITQSLVCIFILFAVLWLQNKTEEPAVEIISEIKAQLVERHISAGEIYRSIAGAYDECVQYIQGVN